MQRRISMVQSAIMGGLIFGKSMVAIGCRKNMIGKGNGSMQVAEKVGWATALLGIYFQVAHGGGTPQCPLCGFVHLTIGAFFRFKLPFPLNICLAPLSIVEKLLAWVVMSRPATGVR